MDFMLLPYKAVYLMLVLLAAAYGAYHWRKEGKLAGAGIGAGMAILGIMLVMYFMPVKLTTNTQAYHKQQERQIEHLHKQLPPRVTADTKTFEQRMAEADAANIVRNQATKKEVNRESN